MDYNNISLVRFNKVNLDLPIEIWNLVNKINTQDGLF